MSDANTTERTEIGNARIDLFTDHTHGDETPMSMAIPSDDDVSVFDLGDLVLDRIEANGRVTFPEERPDEGEQTFLGVVYWDERGIPTRLVREDDVVFFNANGGFDRTEPTGASA